MPLILNIDTATEQASVCLARDEDVIAIEQNLHQKDHASFLQPAIKRLFASVSIPLGSLDAVAVTAGPGSYTGLRVGLGSAKGLCYALDKPLLLINTLQVMGVASVKQDHDLAIGNPETLFCPMIDARRLEVFTAVYDSALRQIVPPQPMILEESSFRKYLYQYRLLFSGSGSFKFKMMLEHPHAIFSATRHSAADMIGLSVHFFSQQKFADIAYSEPFYLKEFFTRPTVK